MFGRATIRLGIGPHSSCDFIKVLESRYWFLQVLVLCALLFLEPCLIVLSMLRYKYRSEYLLYGQLQVE